MADNGKRSKSDNRVADKDQWGEVGKNLVKDRRCFSNVLGNNMYLMPDRIVS